MAQEAIADFDLGYDDNTERITLEYFTFTLLANMEDLITKRGI